MSISNLANPLNLYDVDIVCNNLTVNHEIINTIDVNTLNVVTEIITGTLFSIPTNHTGIEIVNQASPLNAALFFVDNSIDSSASLIPIAGFVSNQINSSIDVRNNNAASTSNGIVFHDNAGNASLQVGSNNSTSTAYVLSVAGDDLNVISGKNLNLGANGVAQYSILQSPAGQISSSIPMSISFPGYVAQGWNIQTVGLSNVIAFTIHTTVDTNYDISVVAQGRILVGATVGDCRSTNLVASFKNVSSAITQVGATTSIYNLNSGGTIGAVTLAFGSGFGDITFSISGPAAYTINWSGIYTITST